MAFLQSTASSQNDVISQLCAFAVANAGFTDQGTATFGGITRYRISKGPIFWSFYAWYGATSESNGNSHHIISKMSYSISDTADPTSANSSYKFTYTSLFQFPGPYPTLYLFTDGNAVHVCIELTTGVFNHISFGGIIKYDTFEGGEYITSILWDHKDYGVPSYLYTPALAGTYVSLMFEGGADGKPNPTGTSYIRNIKSSGATFDEADFAAFAHNRNSNQAFGNSYKGIIQPLLSRSPNTATLRSILLQSYVSFYDYTTSLHVVSGYVPAMRFVNMKFLDPGEIILNNWQVFPYISKSGDRVSYPVTGDYGIAYKRA